MLVGISSEQRFFVFFFREVSKPWKCFRKVWYKEESRIWVSIHLDYGGCDDDETDDDDNVDCDGDETKDNDDGRDCEDDEGRVDEEEEEGREKDDDNSDDD